MSTKFPPFLRACLVAAGSFAALSAGQAQWSAVKPTPKPTPVLMPTKNYDLNPAPAVKPPNLDARSATDKVLAYAWDKSLNAIPVKRLKITNLHPHTIYPVLRDANEATVSTRPTVGLYDPYDDVETEFRGYIGYRSGTNNYFGLESGKSIIIRIPLVFWNAARMSILTDGKYLVPTGTTKNPMQFKSSATMIVAPAEKDPKNVDFGAQNPPIDNGVVMWYKGARKDPAPALDAPDQLVEWTIRDAAYLSSGTMTALTDGKIPKGEKVNLINYDISYVDNMFFPGAIEALDVAIPAPPFPPGRKKQPYGWVGAIRDSQDLQKIIAEFTKDNNKYIGRHYFGGKGWPKYNIPISDIKIPAAQNVFAQSPLANVRSSYNNEAYMLSSGGSLDDPISVSIGVSGTDKAVSGYVVTLDSTYPAKDYEFIKKGYKVVCNISTKPNPVPAGTLVDSYDPKTHKVTLTKEITGSAVTGNLQFFRPATDYASTDMIKLWFSWVNHFLNLPATKAAVAKDIVGGVTLDSPTLTFTGSQSGLIAGMQVTGAGLPSPDKSKSRGGVIILEVAEDGRSVLLSQIASTTVASGTYSFKPPQPLTETPPGTYTFDFSDDKPHPARNPDEFSKKVYLMMASLNQVPKGKDASKPYLNELMNNVIGGNMGFIFANGEKANEPGAIISTVFLREIIKSILRGVTDYALYPDDGKDAWYPDPKIGTGGQKFNVFNLDPFVRFVHKDLGFSGYGFSLDDDTADVGAGEATKLLLTVGGPPPGSPGIVPALIRNKFNANEWTIQAPYGPVEGKGRWDQEKESPYLDIKGASNTTPIVINSPSHNLRNKEKVTLVGVGGNTGANGTFTITNVTKDTFELVGSKGTGAWTGGGKWTTGPLYYIKLDEAALDSVYWRIQGDDRTAGFEGAFVSTKGNVRTNPVRVRRRGDDKLGILFLSEPLTIVGTKRLLPKNRYTWVFSGTERK